MKPVDTTMDVRYLPVAVRSFRGRLIGYATLRKVLNAEEKTDFWRIKDKVTRGKFRNILFYYDTFIENYLQDMPWDYVEEEIQRRRQVLNTVLYRQFIKTVTYKQITDTRARDFIREPKSKRIWEM